jgi:crotonobetainyl-CoA:carnitine CoA-transferase CaiB-like acyl-CoA transferase
VDPLEDLAVLELTQMLAGSFAGQTLAEYGADVVKVERPEYGEIARNLEPKVGGESFYYMSTNRGKQSVALDLKADAGREAFLDLAEAADVVIENFAPGTVEALGVGYEAVSERNSEIIYCSVSAFGQTGPKSDRSGVDYILQAYGGVASMTRDVDGRPLRSGMTVADLAGASYASNAIQAALRRRDRDGVGDYIDVALSDALLSFLGLRVGYSFASNEPFPDVGRAHVYFVPEGIFETADGYVQVSTVTERHWENLCEAIDRDDLADDPAFATADDRRANREQLLNLLDDEFGTRPTDEWVAVLTEHDVPAHRVNDTLSVWDDPQTEAREMTFDVETPAGESFSTVAYPVKHDSWEWTGDDYIAEVGEDTKTILRERGYTEDELDALDEADVI